MISDASACWLQSFERENNAPERIVVHFVGKLFVLGAVEDLGNDAIITESSDNDKLKISDLLSKYKIAGIPENPEFKKIVSGKKLYNFDKSDFKLWRVAL